MVLVVPSHRLGRAHHIAEVVRHIAEVVPSHRPCRGFAGSLLSRSVCPPTSSPPPNFAKTHLEFSCCRLSVTRETGILILQRLSWLGVSWFLTVTWREFICDCFWTLIATNTESHTAEILTNRRRRSIHTVPKSPSMSFYNLFQLLNLV